MPRKKQIPRIALAVYRIKDSFGEDTVFRPIKELKEGGVDAKRVTAAELGTRAEMLVKSPPDKRPNWTDFIVNAVPAAKNLIKDHATQSIALCVDLEKKGRYVLTFGHGHTLIIPEAIERGFGLRCALGLIDDGEMLSVGYKQVDHDTIFSNMQANRRVDFSVFQVDTEAAILSGVVGRPAEERSEYSLVLGSDALRLNPRIDGSPADLTRFLKWVDGIRAKGAYRKKYEWIDSIAVITDPEKIDSYTKTLENHLRSGNPTQKARAWFAPPEAVDFTMLDKFSIAGSRRKLIEAVTLEEVEAARSKIEIADMKKARLYGHDSSGEEIHHWPVFEWLNWTNREGGQTIILQGGNFYAVNREFETRVNKSIKGIPPLPDDYPDWLDRRKKQEEDAYNTKLASAIGGELLDKKRFTKSFHGHGELELCDVLHRAANITTLAFVKKYGGHSSVLSHLFAQGLNSIETLLADEGFRNEIKGSKIGRAADRIAQSTPPAANSLVMAYVILTPDERRTVEGLPFFSKLTLYRAYRHASVRGVAVQVGTRAMKK